MRSRFAWVVTGAFITIVAACSGIGTGMSAGAPVKPSDIVNAIRPLSFDTGSGLDALKDLGEAIRDKRIVLVGENGHGVAQFSTARAQIV